MSSSLYKSHSNKSDVNWKIFSLNMLQIVVPRVLNYIPSGHCLHLMSVWRYYMSLCARRLPLLQNDWFHWVINVRIQVHSVGINSRQLWRRPFHSVLHLQRLVHLPVLSFVTVVTLSVTDSQMLYICAISYRTIIWSTFSAAVRYKMHSWLTYVAMQIVYAFQQDSIQDLWLWCR